MPEAKKLNTITVTTPHAAVKVWNYRDRIGPDGLTFGIDEVDQVIVSTVSLISISVSKTKSSPTGSFELVLAPTKNWIKTLTSGSWLVIMMSNEPINKEDFNVANADKVKFFGRIDTVRIKATIDANGNPSSVYSVTGSDWAQIFNSVLYVDPVARDLNESAISVVNRFIYEDYIDTISKKVNLPSSTFNVRKLIQIWGKTNTTFTELNKAIGNTTVVVKPEISFSVPQAVSDFFDFRTEEKNQRSSKLTELIHLKAGALTKYDTYDTEQREAIGIIKPDSIFGSHTFWQVLMDNCNHALNEMVADMRWENGKAKLALYKRIRPFIIRDKSSILKDNNGNKKKTEGNADDKIVGPLISKFENVRRIEIPLGNVIAIDAGTNWRDKYNYIEIQIDQSLQEDVFKAQIKINNAIYDKRVFGREGFKPLITQTKYIPELKGGSFNYLAIYNWKFILKEWYFNTHSMLNGSMTFTGINDYIQVGDNIIVKSEILGIDQNLNLDSINNKGNTYLLAHVESVSHSFTVNPETNARTYISVVQFVRGIITDSKGKQFTSNGGGAINKDAKAVRFDQEDNSISTVSDKGNQDPGESSGIK